MGNWEFAAVVAAVTLGLGGLMLFTVIAAVGAWRMFGAASEAAGEAARTTAAMQDLARHLSAQGAQRDAESPEVNALRARVDGLAEQQERLQEALRGLAELAQERETWEQHLRDVDGVIRRLEETVSEIAVAVADLNQRMA